MKTEEQIVMLVDESAKRIGQICVKMIECKEDLSSLYTEEVFHRAQIQAYIKILGWSDRDAEFIIKRNKIDAVYDFIEEREQRNAKLEHCLRHLFG